MDASLETRIEEVERRLGSVEHDLTRAQGLATDVTALRRDVEQLRKMATAGSSVTPAVPVAAARPVTSRDAASAPATPTAPVSPWLAQQMAIASDLLSRGGVKDAVKALDRARREALEKRNIAALRQILELVVVARSETGPENTSRLDRLAYATRQNIAYLRRQQAFSAKPVTPPTPAPVAVHAPPARINPPATTGITKPSPTSVAAPAAAVAEPATPRRPRRQLPTISAADLVGPRALAIVGGIVSLLGIVFFFVLAVNRGWIGPSGRVALGAAASLILFTGGWELRRRFGTTEAALAAVGAGIAGAYATMLAAAALYHLLPNSRALVVAALIATVGVVTSLRWNAQLIAGLGLIGAMLVPVAVVAQDGFSPLGTAFAGVMLAATCCVAVSRGWRALLITGFVVSLLQIGALVTQSEYRAQAPASIIILAASFAVVYLGAGIASYLRLEDRRVGQLSSGFIAAAGMLAAASAFRLFDGARVIGIALAVVAIVFALLAATFFSRRSSRDLSAFLAAVAFTLGAVSLAELLSGQALIYAWATEGAALAWLAFRTKELRFQVWSLVYVGLALGHLLLIEAPVRLLFAPGEATVSSAPPAVAVALAVAVLGAYARAEDAWFLSRGGLYGLLARPFAALVRVQHVMSKTAFWFAGILAVCAASLVTLAQFASFDWGHVALATLWSSVGIGVLWAGLRRSNEHLYLGGLIWLGTATAIVVGHASQLAQTPRSWSLLVVSAALFAAALAVHLLERREESAALDLSALIAVAALILGVVGSDMLLTGLALVFLWVVVAASLAWLARKIQAPHHQVLAISLLLLILGRVVDVEAPPALLFTAGDHLVRAAITVVMVAVASAFCSVQSRPWSADLTDGGGYVALRDVLVPVIRGSHILRDIGRWLAAVLLAYAASLVTLERFASFDWGHVAVAALWSALGLAILSAGIRRDATQLRVGGVIWLGTTAAATVAYAQRMEPTPRAYALLIVAAAGYVTGLLYQLGRERSGALSPISACAALLSVGLGVEAVVTLLPGLDGRGHDRGLAILGLCALYALPAGVFIRRRVQRDFATLLGGIATALGATAAYLLLSGTTVVLAWTVTAVMLTWLSRREDEPRLLGGAAVFVALAVGHALVLDSPPSHFLVARDHPGSGAVAVLLAGIALAMFVRFALPHATGKLLERGHRGFWFAGLLLLYAASLAILEGAHDLFPSTSLDSAHHGGHTAVTAFWGILALVLLYLGLTRYRSLRVAGLALFGVSLAKIFLYDLPSLSSITRALSFIAVGGVLLLGGFFYQRLSTAREDTTPEAT